MPKKTRPTIPKPVDAIIHNDKRPNLPTADAQDLVAPEIEAPRLWYSKRRPELDPQLVWKGKDDQDQRDLEVQAPPIYIQEKIDPRVLIENLRRTSRERSQEPELTLFDSFDGLGDLELVEFYQHAANWSNRMILGDSLNVMASLAERESLRGHVQVIYVDPPYGIRFGSNWQATTSSRDVSDGKLNDLTIEPEQIRAFRDTWELGIHSYLSYLRDRLLIARDLLADSGSIFLQIGDANLHLVRSLLDEVFGSENFCSVITFKKTSSATGDLLPGTVDYIVWYAKRREQVKYRPLYRAKGINAEGGSAYAYVELPGGGRRALTREEREKPELLPSGSRIFRRDNLTSQSAGREKGEGAASWFVVNFDGRQFRPSLQSRWKTNEQGMERLRIARRLIWYGTTLAYVRYLDDFPAFALTNSWDDTTIGYGETKTYVVQTMAKVVERCILMASDPGDLVLDPTCGSGTTAFVAEQWGRRWITIDTSRVALALARQRLMGSSFPYFLLADSAAGRAKEQQLSGTIASGALPSNDIRQGFVYERLRHVTLKSIVSNPDLSEGMGREELATTIQRNAEFEVLVDRPVEDRKRVRVSGPFTVESLSPHRALAFAPPAEPVSIREAAQDPSSPTFEDSILANLSKAGIQNGRRQERLEFESIDAYGGTYVQAIGQRRNGDSGPVKVAISIGPQYGTVGPPFIKGAAREAIKDESIDLLCVLGFAFDPTALGAAEDYNATAEGFANVAGERSLGRMPVLLVRMNADLVMGEDLKKTGAGNLFTVFGEPDIEIRKGGGEIEVEIKGVDVYDPTTGEVRSNDPDRIAMWIIDTNYNGESFFVRHCYFTGGTDPYRRLKAALKAEIDEEAWASLYQTTSRPFPRPETGKIAVKVINDYGDEVLKVFEV